MLDGLAGVGSVRVVRDLREVAHGVLGGAAELLVVEGAGGQSVAGRRRHQRPHPGRRVQLLVVVRVGDVVVHVRLVRQLLRQRRVLPEFLVLVGRRTSLSLSRKKNPKKKAFLNLTK